MESSIFRRCDLFRYSYSFNIHRNKATADMEKCQALEAVFEDFDAKFTHSVEFFNVKFTLKCREFNYFF